MNKDNFEDRIKNAFDAYRPEADTDAIWQNIEPRLKKKKKRRFIFFLLFGLGLLLLWRECGNWETGKLEIGSGEVGKLEMEKLEIGNREVGKLEMGNTDLTDRVDDADLAGAKGGNAVLAECADDANLVSLKGRNADLAERTDDAELVEEEGRNADLRDRADGVDLAVVKGGNADLTERADDADLVVVKGGNADLADRADIADLVVVKEGNADLADRADDAGLTGETGRNADLTDHADDAELAGVKNDRSAEDEKTEKDKKRRKKGKKQRQIWMHSLGLQGGPALGIRFMNKNKQAITPSGLLDGRRATEGMMESWAGGLFYSAASRRGLLLQTGLEFRQVNEKFHLAYETVEVDQVNGVLSITVDAAGNTISQTNGPKTITTTKEYLNTTYNHYRFINWPVGAGYRFTSGRRRWEISGGVDFNLMLRFQGALYNAQLQPMLIGKGTLGNGGIYRRSAGWGLWAAWGCDYRLRGPLRWQWGARLQFPLRKITAPDYALNQRYLHFGAHVGLVWAFQPRKKEPAVKSVEPVLSKR